MEKINGTDILLIDDEDVMRDELKLFLTRKGYTVITASNGIDGLAVLDQTQPKIVITDYRMPRMDGITVLREVKKAHPETPVVVMSGNSDKQVCVDALMGKASDFLEKPLDLQELLKVVERLVRSKH